MPEEFMFRDMSGTTFWGVELKGATFRSVDLTGAVVSQSRLVATTVDGFIDGLVINGVDVTAYVNAHDTWYPLRAQVHAGDLDTMRTALGGLEQAWAHTLARASRIPRVVRVVPHLWPPGSGPFFEPFERDRGFKRLTVICRTGWDRSRRQFGERTQAERAQEVRGRGQK